MASRPDDREPLFPYELALANAIVLLIGVAAVLDDERMQLRHRLAGSVVLLGLAALLGRGVVNTGYVPGRATTGRLRADQHNVPGWTAAALIVGDLVIVPALWFS